MKTAPQAIAVDPSSPWGYQTKRTALHGAGRYDDAIQVFETMLIKMDDSPDPEIRGELYARFHDKDDSLMLFNRASEPVRSSVPHKSDDSPNRSTNYTSLATCAH